MTEGREPVGLALLMHMVHFVASRACVSSATGEARVNGLFYVLLHYWLTDENGLGLKWCDMPNPK